METTQFNSRCDGKRGCRSGAAVHSRFRASVSRSASPAVYWTRRAIGLRIDWDTSWRFVCAADFIRVRRRGWLRKAENSLDVVAGNWWFSDRTGRPRFPAGTGSWLRHNWRADSRGRDYKSDLRSSPGQMVHLGGVPWVGYIGWCSSPAVSDGRGAWWSGSNVSSLRGCGFLASDCDGRHSRRYHAISFHERRICVRTHARCECVFTAAGGQRYCSRFYRVDVETLHFD